MPRHPLQVHRGEVLTVRQRVRRVLGASAPGAGWLVLFFAVPLLLIVGVSFLSRGQYGTVERPLTFESYRRLAGFGLLGFDPLYPIILLRSLVLGLGTTLLCVLAGLPLAFFIAGLKPPWKTAALTLVMIPFWTNLLIRLLHIPVFVPDVVMAVSLLLLFKLLRQWLGLFELGLTTMAMAHVTFQIPFVAIVVRSRMAGLDPALEEAAHDLGADARQVFRHVTLPLMLPGVLAGAMLAFTLSLDDFVVSFFTSGPGSTTLPILIYSSVKRGITPDINALSTLLIALSATATVTATLLQRREKG